MNNKTILGIGIPVILLIIGVFVFVPNFMESVGALFTGETTYCNNTPYNANCICPENKQKIISDIWKWSCVDPTDLPTTITFPITDNATAEAYAYEQMNGITCQSGAYYLDLYELGPSMEIQDQYRVECLVVESTYPDGSPHTGSSAWSIWFYKEDGFIKERKCNLTLFGDQCPDDIEFRSKQ